MKLKAIKSKNIVTPNSVFDGYIIYDEGKIIDLVKKIDSKHEYQVIDAKNNVVMPGIIDCHVHINEPGRTEWEGFETATMAAAAGGITTLIEMPLNATPVTTTVQNLEIKTDVAYGKLHVNCGFWGGVVPNNLCELEPLLQNGVFGLKAFLTHSGIDDFPNTNANQLIEALNILKKYNLPLLVHCELDEPISNIKFDNNPKSYKAYLASRPKDWEDNAVKLMVELCRITNARVHVVHVSSAQSLTLIEKAKAEGLKITAETCPHYLFFDAESIQDSETSFKCAPPIREKHNNIQLWDALRNGTLDFVVTDHSPAPPNLKEVESGNFKKAWGGISSLQFLLPVLYTKAREFDFSLIQICKLLSQNTAEFIGLGKTKGKIEIGYDADFVIWNHDKKFRVQNNFIYHKHKITPYINHELYGEVQQTILGGEVVFDNHKFNTEKKGKVIFSANSSNNLNSFASV